MIRRYLIAGLFTLLPLVVTVWILKWIFSSLVGIFEKPVTLAFHLVGMGDPPGWALLILSAAGTFLLLLVAGALVGNLVGRQLLSLLDELMLQVPVVKGIYGATKQLINAIENGKGGSFKEVVLVEWPHPGSFTLGFVANDDCSWAMEGGDKYLAVYIATAPNPTSGYVVMVEASKVRPVHLSANQALTWAISGGVVVPTHVKLPEPPKP